MRCSLEHLKSFVSTELTAQEIGDKLTLAGLELDGIHAVAKPFSGVVIGLIQKAEPHPNADKLQVCTVDIGEPDFLQIVCGAKNAKAGLKVAVAMVGAVLPGDFKIKEAKLRGVESFGMLCSTSELGITEESDGIWELPEHAPVGENLRKFFNFDDVSLEIGLTPNRGDCASVLGLARELSALTGAKLKFPEIQQTQALSHKTLKISIENPQDCPKYFGRVIENINPNAKTPDWMAERLVRAGQRCISPAVDITNYVMLTFGQPMHAFDLDKLQGNIIVRRGKASEKLVLLKEQEINFSKNQLAICDDQGPVALAGIMGGMPTAVTNQTVNIFLESAHFSIPAIAGQARALGLNTDGAYRWERGVDPALPELALDLATQYLIEIAGGIAGPVVIQKHESALPVSPEVKVRLSRVEKLLGLAVSENQALELFKKLGAVCDLESPGVLKIKAPSWRFDLNLEEDWIEEIARMIGLEFLTPTLPISQAMPSLSEDSKESNRDLHSIKQYFVSRGYHEAITYSFISPKLHQMINLGGEKVEILKNPISEDLSVMRTSLLPALLQAAAHNFSRQANRVRLFESGRVFINQQEIEKLGGVIAGKKYEINSHDSSNTDFYDLKADLESLISGSLEFVKSKQDFLHPGRSAEIIQNGVSIGYFGQVHPKIQKLLDVRVLLYVFECDLLAIQTIPVSICHPISKFPEISRDLALILENSIDSQAVISAVKILAGELLQSSHIFDVYQGDKIPEGKKSLALNLILQSLSHTLTDDEVQRVMTKVIEGLTNQFNAQLRE